MKAAFEGRLGEKFPRFSKPKLLVVNELGYLPFEKDVAHVLLSSFPVATSETRCR